MVKVNQFLKISQFVACKKTFDVLNIACLFFNKIVHHHSVPYSLTSNHVVKFISHLKGKVDIVEN